MRPPSRIALLAAAAALPGCLAWPPGRARLGRQQLLSEAEVHYDDAAGQPRTDHASSAGNLSLGVHSGGAIGAPFDVGAGMSVWLHGDDPPWPWSKVGAYLEAAYLRPVRPWLQLGPTAAVEWWWADGDEIGVASGPSGRVGFVAEWVDRPAADHLNGDCTSGAWAGLGAIGLYTDVGVLRMAHTDDVVTIDVGLEVRWPGGWVDMTRCK